MKIFGTSQRNNAEHFFLLGLFTEHNLILGSQHKQCSPCSPVAKSTEVTDCHSKRGLSLELRINYCKYQVWQQLWHVPNVWGALKSYLKSDSPDKSSDFWHLLPETMYTHRYLLTQSWSCSISSKIQLHSIFTCYSYTQASHSACLDTHFLQCWQPTETVTDHSARKKVRWPCYIWRCFGLENLSPG